MCVYVYVHVCVFIYVYIYVYIYICVYIYIYSHLGLPHECGGLAGLAIDMTSMFENFNKNSHTKASALNNCTAKLGYLSIKAAVSEWAHIYYIIYISLYIIYIVIYITSGCCFQGFSQPREMKCFHIHKRITAVIVLNKINLIKLKLAHIIYTLHKTIGKN